MSHYHWKVAGVSGKNPAAFAEALEKALNNLEDNHFQVYDVMDVPSNDATGVAIIGRRPRRFPTTFMDPNRPPKAQR